MTTNRRLQDRLDMIENPESRIPCVIVIDTSGSMMGEPIDEVNTGIRRFTEEIAADELTAMRADVAIIAFNHQYQVVVNFGEMPDMAETHLSAYGGTTMCPPLTAALDMIEARKGLYRESGVPYYRPIALLITDGYPNDRDADLKALATRIKTAEKERKLTFFGVGTEQADMDKLGMLSSLEPQTLRGTNFVALFQWLSTSISRISHSQIGERVDLPAPTGWTTYQ